LLKLYEKPRVGPTRSAGVTTMDPAALFSSANLLYIHQEYEEALKHYTCAVSLEDSADYRVCRAACFIKLGKFAKALEDAEQAMKFDPKSHMAHYWKGIASFYIGEFNTAKLAFEESVKIAPNAKTPRTHWVRKCDAELSGSTLPLQGLAGEVVKQCLEQLVVQIQELHHRRALHLNQRLQVQNQKQPLLQRRRGFQFLVASQSDESGTRTIRMSS